MNAKHTKSQDTDRIRDLLCNRKARSLIFSQVSIDWQQYGEPREVRIERYWPARDGSFAVEWSFQLKQDQRFSLYARLVHKDQKPTPQFAEGATPRIDNGCLYGVHVCSPESDIVIHSPDCDPQLPNLRELLRAELDQNVSDTASSNGSKEECSRKPVIRNKLLSYRAGKRAAICQSMVHQDGTQDRLFCKSYRNLLGEKVLLRHAQVRELLDQKPGQCFNVAGPLQFDAQFNLAKYRWSQGNPMSQDELVAPASLARIARLLAAFHGLALDDLPSFTVSDEITIVDRWLSLIKPLLPECDDMLCSLSSALYAEAESVVDDFSSTIHRDFYPKQVLFDRDRATLLDLDTVSRGSACVDIANYLAHTLLSLDNRLSEHTLWGTNFSKFIQKYQIHRNSVDLSGLRFYFCSSLVRLGAVHAFRHGQMPMALALWKVAQQTLNVNDAQSMRFLQPTRDAVAFRL